MQNIIGGEAFMNKLSRNILRNISLFTFILIYITIAAGMIFLESFQWETQWYVFSTLAPFFLLGAIFDYIVDKNNELSKGYKIFSQLMPSGIFLLYGISVILNITERPPIEAFNYLIWIFVAVPLFVISNFKNNYRNRMFSSVIGTGLVGAIYLHLTTITDELDEGNGLIVYLICIFLMLYAASGYKKLFFIGALIGLIDAAILIFLWKNPITDKAKLYGWDFDIAFKFELLLLATFTLCILISLLSTINQVKETHK